MKLKTKYITIQDKLEPTYAIVYMENGREEGRKEEREEGGREEVMKEGREG